MDNKKKLIEVALPLEDINAACVREKSIRHGHPSTLHLWWARRPLAAARAVIWASLVDDPSSHPEKFPTVEEQSKERERLFSILRELVIWENSNNKEVLEKAKAEILKSTNNNPPALLDPFAGGGAIPFEAARLGLKAYAADLNPVAVMINKAMIEIPARFQGMQPINPNAKSARDSNTEYENSTGIAEDILYYGNLLKEKAFEKIGHLYPKVHIDEVNQDATVIAWLWARTVKCPNPVCDNDMPLVSSFILSKKKGNEAWVEPLVTNVGITFDVHKGKCPSDKESTKGKGASFTCPFCGAIADKEYIHSSITHGKCDAKLMAIVAEGPKGRIYLKPTKEQEEAAYQETPQFKPSEKMDEKSPNLVSGRGFGITKWSELFTDRQLVMLDTLSNLLDDICKQIEIDFIIINNSQEEAHAYSNAIRTYLAFVIDKLSDRSSSFCSWDSSREGLRNVFGRQAIPMVWDYAEANPFSDSSGCYSNMLEWVYKAVKAYPSMSHGEVVQWDATQDNGLRNIMVSTDPPYYDNIAYSDVADFFYIWLRHNLNKAYPSLFSTILTPKANELVALNYRFKGGKEEAKDFFEDGMAKTCQNLFGYTREDIPVTIYYAFKQSDDDSDGKASSGWETMLSAIIKAGFTITGTWPMRTELENRNIASGTNALASSIVIVCRKMEGAKPSTTMRLFADELKSELLPAVQKLQASNIAPVDLAQSAIGPGIAVYSRYKSIIQADGSELSVRDALKLINRELDNILNEHDSDIDTESSLCLMLYSQKGYNEWTFGDVNTLATAKNTSVDALARLGIVESGKGKVRVYERNELKPFSHGSSDCIWLITQQAVRAFENDGFSGIAEVFADISESDVSKIKKLCYQLFSIADKKKWTDEAIVYNSVITSWDDAISSVSVIKDKRRSAKQLEFDLEV